MESARNTLSNLNVFSRASYMSKENDSTDVKTNDDNTMEINTSDVSQELESAISNVDNLDKSVSPSEVTVKRGRLIRQIKKEISKIKNKENISDKDREMLNSLESRLSSELENHSEQLSKRYKEEFSKQKATVGAIFTVLPKGVGLQMRKVVNCINELQQAKTNKEKIFGIVELGKNIGILGATPIVFTAKFIVKHWYLILLLLLLLLSLLNNVPFLGFGGKGKNNNQNNTNDLEHEYATETVQETAPSTNTVPENALEGESVHVPQTNEVVTPQGEEMVRPQPQEETTNPLNDNSLDVPLVPDAIQSSEPLQVDTEKFYTLLRKLVPDEINDNYLVFDTYEDALEYFMDGAGYTRQEAIDLLAGRLGINPPSVSWLVGEGGMFASCTDELFSNYTMEQLEELVAQHQAQFEIDLASGVNISEYISSLSGPALAAFLLYEAIQYGSIFVVGPVPAMVLPG